MPIFIPKKRLLLQLVAQHSQDIAAFTSVDERVSATGIAWKKLHSNVDIKALSRQVNDHHRVITTPLFYGLTAGAVT